MAKKINIDGIEYNLDNLSQTVKSVLEKIQNADTQIQEMTNLYNVLTRAKKSYIRELKREMIEGKSGVDIASLFD
tara:strand:- start:2088 stop:2312 length:225 start_codon:yes stop_codon:yes gene_type:complete